MKGAFARTATVAAPPLFWAAGILWLGSRPHLGAGVSIPGLDKVAHLAMFTGLGYLTARAHRDLAPGWPPMYWIAVAALIGALDEFNQLRVAGRTADPLDFAADAAGVLLGFALFRWSRERFEST